MQVVQLTVGVYVSFVSLDYLDSGFPSASTAAMTLKYYAVDVVQ